MMLLGLLAMGSTNAFAGDGIGAGFAEGGLVYKVNAATIDADKRTAKATVTGVADNAMGKSLITAKAITVPCVVSPEVDGEVWTVTVTGFTSTTWETAVLDASKITKLSVDESNFAAAVTDFSGFGELADLTIIDNAEADFVTWPTYTLGKLKKLDISTCGKITEIPADAFNGGVLESISVDGDKIKKVNDNAFKGCSKLADFPFGKNLEYVGIHAFEGTALTAADLKNTKLTEITDYAFASTKITTVSLSKKVATLWAYAFYKSPVATLTLEDASSIKHIYADALAYTELTELSLTAGTPNAPITIDANAFEGCYKMKTFNFVGANEIDYGYGFDVVDYNAFIGCIPFVTITAPQEYINKYNSVFGGAPLNCKWEAKAAPIKVDGKIAIKNGFAKWFHNTKPIAIDAEKYEAFSVYVDNGMLKKDGTAYFQGLRKTNGRYYINPGEHIILKALQDDVTEVEYEDMSIKGLPTWSVFRDEIFSFDQNYTLAAFQTHATAVFNNWGAGYYTPGQYLYRLTNKSGIGFNLFAGAELIGGKDDTSNKAQFFIQSIKAPDAEGRLNVIWLDEDGNVIEGSTTAIEEVKNETEDGASYNLAGQKVGANYKGVVIKNGKKFMK
jgi:hypothetical protein